MNKRYSDEDLKFLRLNWSKMSDEELGKELGRTWVAIRKMRHKLGYHPRERAVIREHSAKLLDLYLDGLTDEQIGNEMMICRTHAYNIRVGMQLPRFNKNGRVLSGKNIVREWYCGDGRPVAGPHVYVDEYAEKALKLNALRQRRQEIVACMMRMAEFHVGSCAGWASNNEYEWKRLKEAYRETRLAIDQLSCGVNAKGEPEQTRKAA